MSIAEAPENSGLKTDRRKYFQPGNKAALGYGRPRVVRSIQALARANTERAFRALIRNLKCGIPRTEVAAATEVLNRGWGKAPIKIDMGIQSFESFSPEARAAIDLICQLLASQAEANANGKAPPMIDGQAIEITDQSAE